MIMFGDPPFMYDKSYIYSGLNPPVGPDGLGCGACTSNGSLQGAYGSWSGAYGSWSGPTDDAATIFNTAGHVDTFEQAAAILDSEINKRSIFERGKLIDALSVLVDTVSDPAVRLQFSDYLTGKRNRLRNTQAAVGVGGAAILVSGVLAAISALRHTGKRR